MNSNVDTALLISNSARELNKLSVLGTGGWQMPEEREELDWMTLIKFMGWRVLLIHPSDFKQELIQQQNIKWIILCNTEIEIKDEFLNDLFFSLQSNPVIVVAMAGKAQGLLHKFTGMYLQDANVCGQQLEWTGNEKKSWHCRKEIQLSGIELNAQATVLATLSNHAIAGLKKIGAGKIICLSFHPSAARDVEGSFTSLLRHLLIYESEVPVVWLQWDHTLILRMDDPGSHEIVYNEAFQNTKLSGNEWKMIGDELKKRKAKMSLGYVPGWVDDGNDERGSLYISGQKVARIKGAIHPSSTVRYVLAADPNKIYDFEDEFKGIENLRKEGLVEVELHGYTHLHPDRVRWANAADRYTNTSWYREFGKEKIDYINKTPGHEHPLYSGLKAFSALFNCLPTTLICPGEEFTEDVVERSLKAGLAVISSYYTAIMMYKKIYWAQHVCAPYLDKTDPAWFDAELPVVGYFHDFDISINGIYWFVKCLDEWENAGAKRFIDFREMAGLLNLQISTNQLEEEVQINVKSDKKWASLRSVPIGIFIPHQTQFTRLSIKVDNKKYFPQRGEWKQLDIAPYFTN